MINGEDWSRIPGSRVELLDIERIARRFANARSTPREALHSDGRSSYARARKGGMSHRAQPQADPRPAAGVRRHPMNVIAERRLGGEGPSGTAVSASRSCAGDWTLPDPY